MYYSILKENLVAIAKWTHLFPSRTQKLSTLALIIVGWIARKGRSSPSCLSKMYASVAQLVRALDC